jgi:hypothetical protein
MRAFRPAIVCLFLLLASSALAQQPTWDAVKAEADPEKQSEMALELAQHGVDGIVEAYRQGLPEEARAMSARIVEAAELSLKALEASGKDARSRPKHFKRAEIATRRLARSLQSAQRQLIYDEREDLEPVIKRIEAINGEILSKIMQTRR